MRIAILANLVMNAPRINADTDSDGDLWDDLDSPYTIDALSAALREHGHTVEFFEASILPPHNLIERLQAFEPDLCFNIAEGHFGDSREAHIPSILEMLQLPYTGSRVMTLALALDKPMTKRVLMYHGLPTPEFQVFERADELVNADLLNDAGDELRFPLFVKPSREGTSVGISATSIVNTLAELEAQVTAQLDRYRQPILVEHYIEGREITVGVIGNLGKVVARRINERTLPDDLPDSLHFFPTMEIDTGAYGTEEAGLYTNRIKTDLVYDFKYLCPAPISGEQEHHLQLLTAAVFRVTGCKDVARVDFRFDAANGDKPYILEVNPLPGLNPDYSDLCLQAKAAGWSYAELVNAIVDEAALRHGIIEVAGLRRRMRG